MSVTLRGKREMILELLEGNPERFKFELGAVVFFIGVVAPILNAFGF